MTRQRLTSLAAGAVLACAPLGAAAAAHAATSPSSARATIVDCSGHKVVAPRDYVLACGDGDTSLTHLRWSHWGSADATATATEELNLCRPDCVSGKTARFAVTVVAEHLRDGRYQELVVRAGAHRPHGVPTLERWYPIKPGQ